MAGIRTSRDRIEPTLGTDDKAEDDIRLDSSDRVTGRGKSRPDRSAGGQTPGRGRRSDTPEPGRGDRKRPRGLFARLRRLFYWCFVLGIWAVIGVGGLVIYFASQMPSASTWAVPDRAPNIKILAVDGSVIANRGVTGGEALSLEDMSPWLPQAIVAIEDRRFYSHVGVDPQGLARAIFTNLVSRRAVQGGSTITQQLAKNLFLSPDRTLERKVQEVLLALWLEHKFTKEQILTMYLNRVYFGSNAYGVEAAARRYFNKSARDVNLGEAALLAGLVKAPSRLSPAANPQAARDRAQVVLGAMRDQGLISDSDLNRAMAQPPTRAKSYWTGAGQYVADMVVDELKGIVGEVKQDVVVTTTIDPALEKEAQEAIARTLDKDGAKSTASQAALVSIDGNGAIRALVGGRDYATSQFNRAVKAKRQPGSAFKPFVYAAAMELGDTPATVRNDAPVKIGTWTPENYEQKYNGPVTLGYAFAHSLNTIAAQLVVEAGPDQVIKLAHRLGIESELQSNASIALGTSEVSLLELTAAYAPFMNGGYKATPHVIAQVTDGDGKPLYNADFGAPPRVLNEQVVRQMTMLMEAVVTDGTGKSARLKAWQSAGKTGTTQSFRDALFVGFTSNLTTGVWFGNDDGTPMKKVTGGGLPARTWKDFMTAAHKGLTPVPLFGDPVPVEPQEPSLTSMIEKVLSGKSEPDRDAYPPAPVVPGLNGPGQADGPLFDPITGRPLPDQPALHREGTGQPQSGPGPARQRAATDPGGLRGAQDPDALYPADPLADPDPVLPPPRRGGGRQDGAVLEGPVPPGAVLEGPVRRGAPRYEEEPVDPDYPPDETYRPPADVGAAPGSNQTGSGRQTTLYDIIMGR